MPVQLPHACRTLGETDGERGLGLRARNSDWSEMKLAVPVAMPTLGETLAYCPLAMRFELYFITK